MSEQPAELAALIAKAEQGDADAQFNLGNLYLTDQADPQNIQKTAIWYRKAAEQEHAGAQCNLGWMYAHGRGVAQNDEEALIWYHKAAAQNNAKAQFNLGFMSQHGRGVAQSDEEALIWYHKAAEQDDIHAQFNLGGMYQNGLGTPQNDEEAAVWYRKAGEQEHAGAQFNLGCMYQYGQGVQQDDREAMTWYLRAAQQNYARAQFNLGLMYMDGAAIEKNLDDAMSWFRKAAEQDHTSAQFTLGVMYMEGTGIEKNLDEAMNWFHRAADDAEIRFKVIEFQDKIEREKLSPEITAIREHILDRLKVDTDKLPTMTHYTSLAVGHALLLEESPLRLNHINAVNDPNEGKLLWRTLGHDPVEANPVFIGCFLPENDNLNMWRFYSKNHRNDGACGCAITFQVADFFDYRLLGKEVESSSDSKINMTYANTMARPLESASFYRVVYLGANGHFLNDMGAELDDEFERLQEEVNNFLQDQPTNEQYQQLARLLGPLPYLLKDADYKDEQEHRLVVTHLEYGAKEIQCVAPDFTKDIPPSLYLELHREHHLKPIKHVTLGPEAPHKEMMAPYWYHQLAMKFGGQLKDRGEFYIKASTCSYK